MKTILILEDEAILGLSLKVFLTKQGFNVLPLQLNAKKALDLFKNQKPDLVIADICLNTELDGIDTVKMMQKEKDFPVIFVSGYQDKETMTRAKSVSKSMFFSKPLNYNQLITSIKRSMETA